MFAACRTDPATRLRTRTLTRPDATMFDADYFFSRGFVETVQDLSRAHDQASLRLEAVTLAGERIDTLQLRAAETVVRLSTRDDRLVLVPYSNVASIDLSVMRDHRVAGFQLATSSEPSKERYPQPVGTA